MLVRIFKKTSIKRKTVVFALLALGVSILLSGLMFYALYLENRNSTIEKMLDDSLAEKKLALENYFDDLEYLVYSISFSPWMQNMSGEQKSSQSDLLEQTERVEYFLQSVADMNGGFTLAAILNNGIYLNSSTKLYIDYSINLEEQDWYPEFIKNGFYMETGNGRGIHTKGKEWYANLYYPMRDAYTFEQTGILIVTLSKEQMKKIVRANSPERYMSLWDDRGEIVYSDSKDEQSGIWNSLREAQTVVNVGDGWTLEIKLNVHNIQMNDRQMLITYTILLVFVVVLVIGSATMYARYFTIPILKCKNAMKEIGNNRLGIVLENDYADEIGELIDGFNEMSNAITELIEKNQTIGMLQRETEYRMLQQQINPHFLYNSLEIINGLIMNEEGKTAVGVCEALGRIFRYNLKNSKWITIREEGQYLRQYAYIMSFNMKGFAMNIDIEQEVYNESILRAILQPLLENSIRHGAYNGSDGLAVEIRIYGEKKTVAVQVMDNGKGISGQRLNELKKMMQEIRENPNVSTQEEGSIGLRNIYHRLYLEYGERMSFLIASEPFCKTIIEIKYPVS